MKRHLIVVWLLLGIVVTGLTGCRLVDGGGSDGPNIAALPTSTTTITTSITRPVLTTQPGNKVTPSLRANGITTEAVTGAVVTLTMSDGTKYTMTDNGNGKYTAVVSNIEGAKGFLIEAHKGDLVVQNLITDLKNTDLANITTDHITTAFTQIALAFAKNQGTIKLASAEDLIKNVTNITIDLSTLRKEVTDETNVTYTLQRELFTYALAEANPNATDTTSFIEKLANGTKTLEKTTLKWEDVINKPITNGTLAPPVVVPTDDETVLKEIATNFMNYVGKAMSGTALNQNELQQVTAMLSEDFILNGMNKDNILLLLGHPESNNDQNQFVSFNGNPVFRKLDDTTYLLGVQGTVTMKNKETNVQYTDDVDSFRDGFIFDKSFTTYSRPTLWQDSIFPVVVKKDSTGTWKIVGNGVKVGDVTVDLHFDRRQDGNNASDTTNFWFRVEETTSYPIASVTVTGKNINGSLNLVKKPSQDDSNAWKYWGSNGMASYPMVYPDTGWPLSGSGSVTHQNGDEYTITVKFKDKDNTQQTFKYKVAGLTSGYQPLVGARITAGNDGVTVTWPKNTFADFDNYDVSVDAIQESGNNRILKKEIRSRDELSASFPYQTTTYTLTPGSQIHVMVYSWRKVGIAQGYSTVLTIPNYTQSNQ